MSKPLCALIIIVFVKINMYILIKSKNKVLTNLTFVFGVVVHQQVIMFMPGRHVCSLLEEPLEALGPH